MAQHSAREPVSNQVEDDELAQAIALSFETPSALGTHSTSVTATAPPSRPSSLALVGAVLLVPALAWIAFGVCQAVARWGGTPLHAAAHLAYTPLCAFLLDHGANITARDSLAETPLHYAARTGGGCLVLFLEHGADLTAKTNAGFTPLHAAVSDDVAAATLLLDRGASLAATDTLNNGYTPLHLAASGGFVRAATLFLDYGADPAAKDHVGGSPLHRAAQEGCGGATRVLLDRGAGVEAETIFGPGTLLCRYSPLSSTFPIIMG